MSKECEFCMCQSNKGVHAVEGEFGYWLYCTECDRKIEDEFHYYNEPDDIY
ncbi:hypothetical protein [Neobacillus bataviensis]|uniref:hypothetical protein n=1 Tax=Neobacillus bataviensis TaxID=220685 RepID=UPI00031C2038|nr:hypothetical protein [Neobacillus bataviensis]